MFQRIKNWWHNLDEELEEMITPPSLNRHQRRHPGVSIGATKFGSRGASRSRYIRMD
jgi:hypothetical protein